MGRYLASAWNRCMATTDTISVECLLSYATAASVMTYTVVGGRSFLFFSASVVRHRQFQNTPGRRRFAVNSIFLRTAEIHQSMISGRVCYTEIIVRKKCRLTGHWFQGIHHAGTAMTQPPPLLALPPPIPSAPAPFSTWSGGITLGKISELKLLVCEF